MAAPTGPPGPTVSSGHPGLSKPRGATRGGCALGTRRHPSPARRGTVGWVALCLRLAGPAPSGARLGCSSGQAEFPWWTPFLTGAVRIIPLDRRAGRAARLAPGRQPCVAEILTISLWSSKQPSLASPGRGLMVTRPEGSDSKLNLWAPILHRGSLLPGSSSVTVPATENRSPGRRRN